MCSEIVCKLLASNVVVPTRATAGSAGYDLYSPEEVALYQGIVTKVPLGLILCIPPGYEGQVRSRSGLAAKGIAVYNAPGTIDSDYRGEVAVLLINNYPKKYIIQPGDKIAQLVISRVEYPSVRISSDVDATERGQGGFGSTGQ